MSTESTLDPDERPDAQATNTVVDDADVADPDEDAERIEVDHAPPRLSQLVGVAAALLGTALTALFAPLAIPFGISGAVIFAASLLVTYSTRWLTIGTALILVGAMISGAFGVMTPELLLLAVGATLVGWDAGQHGIVVGDQLGRQTKSQRNQLVHVAATVLVVALISVFSYLVYLLGSGGRPGPAVATVVLGIVLTAWLFRR